MRLDLSPILAILASSLALPTTDENTSLEKRERYGFISSYTNDDCSGPHQGPRPKLKFYYDELSKNIPCVKFTPFTDSDYIGINYGVGIHEFDEVYFYEDDGCKIANLTCLKPCCEKASTFGNVRSVKVCNGC